MTSERSPRLLVKICGVKTPEAVEAAINAGADMLGLNFHPKSPRYITAEVAASFVRQVAGRARCAVLVVDPEDGQLSLLQSIVAPDLFQFHGQETPERVQAVRSASRLPVMKAIGVGSPADLAAIPAYAAVAEHILLDAKPPKDAAYPGGHGKAFDWQILSALPPGLPFMLSGGLSPENVGEAIRIVRGMGLTLSGVDVSSGVESAPGVKDLGRIRAFIAAAREADGV